MSAVSLFTIGHSTHPIDFFISLLTSHDIDLVVDVRSTPYSRWQPQFNREPLAASLNAVDLDYLFLGDLLGARTSDQSCYENGRVQYDALAQTDLFRRGLDQVMAEAAHHRVALMCAEKEPLECHRTLLVGRELESRGASIFHILADGQLESGDETMSRLLRLMRLPEATLFETRLELIEQACKRQEEVIAYRDETAGALL